MANLTYASSKPITINSTNVTLDDYAPYDSNATYQKGSKVTVVADKKNYWCLSASSKGQTPKDNPNIWEAEPMNAYAMFDYTSSKKTTNPELIKVSFSSANIDKIALFQVEALYIDIKVSDMSGEVVFQKRHSMVYDDLDSFSDYLFSEREFKESLSVPLPIFHVSNIEIMIVAPTATCGYLAVGRQKDLGVSVIGGSDKLLSFSKKERDSWGNMTIQKAQNFNIIDLQVNIPNQEKEQIIHRYKNIDAVPCVFQTGESQPMFALFFDLELPHESQSTTYTIRLESILS